MREAARAVNVYRGSARNRAMATGRPVGVVMKRFENEGNVCFALDQVEPPPVFVGATLDAFAQVRSGPLQAQFVVVDGSGNLVPDTSMAGMLRVGDQIRFNHQGYWYRIDGPDSGDGTITGTPIQLSVALANPGQNLPWPTGSWSLPTPYEIRRQPNFSSASAFRASVSKPLQLPLDAVIDLTFSGGGGVKHYSDGTEKLPQDAFAGNTGPVMIMFSPSGGLDSVCFGARSVDDLETIYLLIGKRERIPGAGAEDGLSNLEDLESLWIAINPRTGLVSTVENHPIDPANPIEPIEQARFFTSDVQTMGGR